MSKINLYECGTFRENAVGEKRKMSHEIDRDLLSEMGFSRGKREEEWGHEVWCHPINFWVLFDSPDKKCHAASVNAMTETRGEFLAKFLYHLEQHFIDQAYIHYEPLFH